MGLSNIYVSTLSRNRFSLTIKYAQKHNTHFFNGIVTMQVPLHFDELLHCSRNFSEIHFYCQSESDAGSVHTPNKTAALFLSNQF